MLRSAARRLSRAASSLQRAQPAWSASATAAARGDAAALPRGALAHCRAQSWRAVAEARCLGAARGLSGGASHEPPQHTDDEEEAEEGDAQVLSEASLQSIVKVFTVHSSPNYYMPWQNKPQRESTGARRRVRRASSSGFPLRGAHAQCTPRRRAPRAPVAVAASRHTCIRRAFRARV
jgi:hypothetical protein